MLSERVDVGGATFDSGPGPPRTLAPIGHLARTPSMHLPSPNPDDRGSQPPKAGPQQLETQVSARRPQCPHPSLTHQRPLTDETLRGFDLGGPTTSQSLGCHTHLPPHSMTRHRESPDGNTALHWVGC